MSTPFVGEIRMFGGKVKMLAGRGDGPHPFEIGSELVQRYFEVTRNGARAAQIRLEQVVAES